MNFTRIIEATREACGKKGTNTFLLNMAVDEIREQTNEIYKPGWEIADFDKSKISNFYINFRSCLQFIGMMLMDGNEECDKILYEELTEVLAAFREVLIQNFSVELPEARVVSMVTEMVERGFLEQFRDEEGVLCVKPKEPQYVYGLKIKIVKTPDGPAPEEFRQKWTEAKKPLPALKFGPGGSLHPRYKDGGYRVPKEESLAVLREVSPEGADCLAEIFWYTSTLIFHLDEAEIVP